MKFSVLLPTRNRLDLLRGAVETVRRQDDAEWEVIVSDNCSEEDVGGYVRSLGDTRVKYLRTDRFIPVTDNWNAALDASTGDYVIMLGDDDGLMPGYFAAMRGLLAEFPDPDLVYHNAFVFALPGDIPLGSRDGFLNYGYADFLAGKTGPFWLPPAAARERAAAAAEFRYRYGFNMQYVLVSRRMVDRLRTKGAFYQSPYPDYYAMNALFLAADRIVADPTPRVAIGITPKSFGYYFFNGRQGEGVGFLNNTPPADAYPDLATTVLPGNPHTTNWLLALETVRRNFADEYPGFAVDTGRYRHIQAFDVCMARYYQRSLGDNEFSAFRSHLRTAEALWVFAWAVAFWVARRVPTGVTAAAGRRVVRFLGQYPDAQQSLRTDLGLRTMTDLFDRICDGGDPLASGKPSP